MEESDAKVQQNAQTGLDIPAEAVNNSAEGNQAIPPTDVNDSLKRQATELNTEYEVQKKKLKMDNLTQQELKWNGAVSKEIKIMTMVKISPEKEIYGGRNTHWISFGENHIQGCQWHCQPRG